METAKDPLSIAYYIADQSKLIIKMLVVGYKTDGSTFILDTDLTADEAKKLCTGFISWIDQSLGREMERNPDA